MTPVGVVVTTRGRERVNFENMWVMFKETNESFKATSLHSIVQKNCC